MAFGTIEKSPVPDAGILRGTQKKAAVKCWFTASGRAIPLSMKLEDENGEILRIGEIRVKTCEKKYYAGIVSWEYVCSIQWRGRAVEAVLLFQPETCCWKLII